MVIYCKAWFKTQATFSRKWSVLAYCPKIYTYVRNNINNDLRSRGRENLPNLL